MSITLFTGKFLDTVLTLCWVRPWCTTITKNCIPLAVSPWWPVSYKKCPTKGYIWHKLDKVWQNWMITINKKPLSWNKGYWESERRGSNSRHPPWQGGRGLL